MEYENLIKTISEIVENDNINKTGLILVYSLPEKRHIKLNEHLFYKSNPITTIFEPSDAFEVEVEGIIVKFIKEDSQLEVVPKNLDN